MCFWFENQVSDNSLEYIGTITDTYTDNWDPVITDQSIVQISDKRAVQKVLPCLLSLFLVYFSHLYTVNLS